MSSFVFPRENARRVKVVTHHGSRATRAGHALHPWFRRVRTAFSGAEILEDIARLDARGFSAGGVDGVVSAGTRVAGTRVWHSCGRGDALPVLAAAASCQGFAPRPERALRVVALTLEERNVGNLRLAVVSLAAVHGVQRRPPRAPARVRHDCGLGVRSAPRKTFYPRSPTPARAVAPVNVASALGTRPTRVTERSSTTAAPLAARRRMRHPASRLRLCTSAVVS